MNLHEIQFPQGLPFKDEPSRAELTLRDYAFKLACAANNIGFVGKGIFGIDAVKALPDMKKVCEDAVRIHTFLNATEDDFINGLEEEIAQLKEEHQTSCETIAKMHAAAVGEVRGPDRGVVEDVADLRANYLQLIKDHEELLRVEKAGIGTDVFKVIGAIDFADPEDIAFVAKGAKTMRPYGEPMEFKPAGLVTPTAPTAAASANVVRPPQAGSGIIVDADGERPADVNAFNNGD